MDIERALIARAPIRANLLNSVSKTALGALLIGLAIGVALPGEARAGGVTVNPVQTTTYYLNASANPITFGSGTNIDVALAAGVSGNSAAVWNVTNR